MIRAVATVLAVVLDTVMLAVVVVTVRRHRRDTPVIPEVSPGQTKEAPILEKEPRHVRL